MSMTAKETFCQCTGPGNCPLLKKRMVGTNYAICQGTSGLSAAKEQEYRDLWARNANATLPASPPVSRGLGDVAEKVFRYTGVAAAVRLVERVTGKPCDCPGRQKDWNNSAASRLLGFEGTEGAAAVEAATVSRAAEESDCPGRAAGHRALANYYAIVSAMNGQAAFAAAPLPEADVAGDEDGEPINLYCMVSPQFTGLYYDWFLRSLAAVQDPGIKLRTLFFAASGNGNFGTPAYNAALVRRLEKLLGWIDRHDGEILAFSDIDIVWLKPFSASLRRALDGVDVVYQSEGRPDQPQAVNGGLFAIRCSPLAREFYAGVLEEIGERGDLDQAVISRRLPGSGLRFRVLPRQFANTNLMRGARVEPDTICFHAINTIPAAGVSSLERKRQQFAAIEPSIGSPRAPRQSRQVVVAKYQESIDWVKGLPCEAVVYDKSADPGPGSNPLPNVGREAHTYAHHICENWDRLADLTVFSQGNPFLHTGPAFLERVRRLPDGVQFVDLVGHFIECDRAGLPHHPGLPIAEVWERLFPDIDSDWMPARFCFGTGAIFAASREAIQRLPLAWWQGLRDFLATDELEGAWVLERLWPTILGET
jgi:hypothetical protein